MAVRLVVGGACEDIILPCPRDTFYADANSCGHYYRCQGYQVWRNKCPPGTASMRHGATPCGGRSWHCDPKSPQDRCAKVKPTETEDNDGCTLRFDLPCKNVTRFLDPMSCGYYMTCRNREQGHVLGRKPCDLPARCHRMKNNQYCTSDGQPKCHKKGIVTVVGEPDEDVPMNMDDTEVNHTALIVGLVMATVISILILGFLMLIFYKRKQKKKRPPCLPSLTVSAPVPINEPCQSVRYSQVDRPISILTYSEPNNYSAVSDTICPHSPGFEPYKGDFYIPSDQSGLYEEIDSCREGPAYSLANDGFDRTDDASAKPMRKITTIVPRRPIRRMTDSRPLSDDWHRPSESPTAAPPRPFSLTSLTAPRPPLEPPRDSCANLNSGYSHPYFILPSNRPVADAPTSPSSPVSPTSSRSLVTPGSPTDSWPPLASPLSPTNKPKYYVLEKGVSDREADAVSVDTTYCEIDDAHFLPKNDSYRTSYPNSFV